MAPKSKKKETRNEEVSYIFVFLNHYSLKQKGGNLSLNQSPIVPLTMVHNEEATKLERLASSTISGVMIIDLDEWKDRLTFGRWNNRPLVDSEVGNLKKSFDGVFTPLKYASAIKISMSMSDWVGANPLVRDPYDLDKIPRVSLDMLNPDVLFDSLSGQHRTKAVVSRKEDAMNLIADAEEKMNAISAAARENSSSLTKERKEQHDSLRLLVAKEKGGLDKWGPWLAIVYDKGETFSSFSLLCWHRIVSYSTQLVSQENMDGLCACQYCSAFRPWRFVCVAYADTYYPFLHLFRSIRR